MRVVNVGNERPASSWGEAGVARRVSVPTLVGTRHRKDVTMKPNPSAAPQPDLLQPRPDRAGAMRIAGLRSHFTSASLGEIPALWRQLVSVGKVPGRSSPVDYAVVLPRPDGCEYLAGFEVSKSATLPKDFASAEIPANEYAVFSHHGHVSTLRNTFDSIFRHWLPASGFEMAATAGGEPYLLERYGERFDPATGTGDIEIWIPVCRRSSE